MPMENGQQPATKADLRGLEEKIDRRFEDMVELLRDTETKLLQAFYGYAESNRKRMGQNEADTAILSSRVNTLEERLMQVEKRLNIPPQA